MHHSIANDLHFPQVCEMKNCNKCLFFEAKKKQDLYMWWVSDLNIEADHVLVASWTWSKVNNVFFFQDRKQPSWTFC